jgi:hypothetical protein
MSATVDDFIRRFGDGGTMDDREASQYYDRFASTDPRDRDFDNDTMYDGASEYLGKLPDDQFSRAAQNAFQQAPPQQRSGFVGGLLNALQGRGVTPGALQGQLGLNSLDPNQLGAGDYARLMNYARHQHPSVVRDQVRQQPALVKALGNPVVMGILGVVASRMIRKQTR